MFFCTLSPFSVLSPVSLMNYPHPCISAAAVRGVHRQQQSSHQVADRERPGLDNLLRRWGKLQRGGKQDLMVILSLLHSVHSRSNLWLFVDWEGAFPLRQIDLTELLESWAAENMHSITDPLVKVKPVWRDASFTLKYYSDALFDFPHWFGFSKRQFKASVSFFLININLSIFCIHLTRLLCSCLLPLQLRPTASSGWRWAKSS